MILDNGELFGLDPFGQPYSRKLPSLPAAMAPLDNAPAGPAEAPGNGPAILVVYKTGEAETLRWNRENADWSALPFPALEAAPLAVINRGDKIAAAMANGRITLRSLDGQILWAEESHISAGDTATEAAMVYDEWGIYTFTQSGATGYSEGGKQLWTLRIQGAAGLPALGEEGILYSGGEDWILYAYHVEDRIRAEKQSFYGPVPKGSYGGGNPRPSPWVTYDYPFGGEAVSAQLGIITKAIRAGRVGEHEKNYAAYLMEIAGSTAEALRTGNANQPSAQVNHRIEAAQLLAYIGSRDTIPFLAYLCQTDPDALVQSAAAEAIGRIGVDPDGNAFRAFSALIFPLSTKKDPRLLASIAAATGSICRFSGPPLSYAGIKLLAALAGAGSPSLAQRAAQQELRSLLY
jgi:outer membrane protein assembly factor BamB